MISPIVMAGATIAEQKPNAGASTLGKTIEPLHLAPSSGRELSQLLLILTYPLPQAAGSERRHLTLAIGSGLVYKRASPAAVSGLWNYFQRNIEPGENVYTGTANFATVSFGNSPASVTVSPLEPLANVGNSGSVLSDAPAFEWSFVENDDEVKSRFGQETYDLSVAAVKAKEQMINKHQKAKAIRKIARIFSKFTD